MNRPPWRKLLARRPVRMAAAAAVVAAAGLAVAWHAGFDREALKALWGEVEGFLRGHLWALFLALVVLPGLPFPSSVLLVTTGAVLHDHPLLACLLCLVALALNMSWTYWLAAGPGRRWVVRLIRLFGIEIPVLPGRDHLRLILVLRLTPGVPLFLQNYALGFLHAPFRLYLPLSIVLTGLFASGFVLVGAGVSDGRFMPVLSGAALVAAGAVLTHWLRVVLQRRAAANRAGVSGAPGPGR